MNEYKIEVANEAESKEVQELFFELGYKWLGGDKCVQLTDATYLFTSENLTINCLSGHYTDYFNTSPHQQITLPELRILALLNRNDMNDANHVDEDGDKWFISGDDCYLFGFDNEWVRGKTWYANHYGAKPITLKNSITLNGTEYTEDEALKLIWNHFND